MKSIIALRLRSMALVAACIFVLCACMFPTHAQAADINNLRLDHYTTGSTPTMAGSDYTISFQVCDKTTGEAVSGVSMRLYFTFPNQETKTYICQSGVEGQCSFTIPSHEMVPGRYTSNIYAFSDDSDEEVFYSYASFAVFNFSEAQIEAHFIDEEGSITDEYVVGHSLVLEVAVKVRTADGLYTAYEGDARRLISELLLRTARGSEYYFDGAFVETPSPGVFRITIDPKKWLMSEPAPGETLKLSFRRNQIEDDNYTIYNCNDAVSFPVVATPTPWWTVTFDDGVAETAVSQVPVREGSPVLQPEEPEREGYHFLGWYQLEGSSLASNPWNFSDPITGDITLVAQWEKIPTDVDDEEKPETDDSGSESHTGQDDKEEHGDSSAVDDKKAASHKGSNRLPATGDPVLLAVAFGAVGTSCMAFGTISRRRQG